MGLVCLRLWCFMTIGFSLRVVCWLRFDLALRVDLRCLHFLVTVAGWFGGL